MTVIRAEYFAFINAHAEAVACFTHACRSRKALVTQISNKQVNN